MSQATEQELTLYTEQDFADAMAEMHRRKQEAIQLYRAMLTQVPFHLSTASEKLARGGQRSGKTTVCAVEVSSAILGIPVRGPDGKELPFLYPKGRPLLIWVIGFDEKHIGRIWHKLFGRTMFKVMRDKETGDLRPLQPSEAEDPACQDQIEMAPPLIPPRMVKEWGWENKAERAFTICRLHNGTEICAFSSGAEAATGDAVDIIWIDEAIKYP